MQYFLPLRNTVKYSFIVGFSFCIWLNIVYFYDFQLPKLGENLLYVSLFLLIFGIYFGIREKRNQDYRGVITFINGFKTGIYITILSAVLICIFYYIFVEYINPGYMDAVLEKTTMSMKAAGKSNISVEEALNKIIARLGTRSQITRFFALSVVGGTLTSVISSLILRKSKADQPLYV